MPMNVAPIRTHQPVRSICCNRRNRNGEARRSSPLRVTTEQAYARGPGRRCVTCAAHVHHVSLRTTDTSTNTANEPPDLKSVAEHR